MVMVIHLHILTEYCAIAYRDTLQGIQGTIVVEKHMVANYDFSTFIYH